MNYGNKHTSYCMFHFPLTFQLRFLCLQKRWKRSTSMDIPQFYAKTCQILLFIMACLIIIEFSKMTFQSHKLLLVSWFFCGGYLIKAQCYLSYGMQYKNPVIISELSILAHQIEKSYILPHVRNSFILYFTVKTNVQ